MKPGVTLAKAQADVSTIAHRLAVEYPKSDDGEGILLISLHHWLGWSIRFTLLILLAAVALLLLIVGANLANLLLARGATRQREMAVRVSLGAGRRRLILQMLVESILLALIGGAAALQVGQWSIELIRALKPDNLPNLQQLGISLPVFWFTLLISILTGIIFGLAPAFQVSGVHLNEALKSGASGSRTSAKQGRARNVLVVAQVALCVLLLAGAGLMIRSFARFVGLDPGFDPDHLLRFEIELPRTEYSQVTQVKEFYRRALNRVRAIPGVESAAISYPLPPGADETDATFYVEGCKPPSPSAAPDAIWHIVTPGYFHTMRTKILKGRAFTPDDTNKSRPVIVINQTLMRHFFPHQDPIGQRLEVDANSKFATIVGVASDEAYAGWEHLYSNEIYFPLSQLPWMATSFVVRTKVAPAAIGPEVRKEIWSVDKDLPVVGMETMEQSLDQAYTPRRFDMALLLAFAVLGISVAAVGIYGVISYQVAQRTHEFGIRMALGAQKDDVLKMVVGQGLKLALAGVATGIVASLGLTRFLSSLLYGVKSTDPLTFIAVSLILTAVALLACYIPARRATRVDPITALRYE